MIGPVCVPLCSHLSRYNIKAGLWWNWVVDKNHYQDWPGFIAHFRAQGIRVLNYINPMVLWLCSPPPRASLIVLSVISW